MFEIFGTGIDIIENKRIKNLFAKYGEKFLFKIFSVEEINLARSKFISFEKDICMNFFAKRFAAKEAFSKALGTGFNAHLAKKNISILNNENGAPYIFIRDEQTISYILKITNVKTPLIKSLKEFDSLDQLKFFVSLSDEKQFSIAQVLIYKNFF